MYKKIQQRVFEIIEKGNIGDKASVCFDLFIMTLISLNVVAVFVETFRIEPSVFLALKYFEFASVVVFSVEYFLRLWTAPCLFPGNTHLGSRIRYIFSFMALIDLFAIIPFYLPIFVRIDLRVVRALRVCRLLRLLKLNRYTKSMRIVFQVLRLKSVELMSSVFIVIVLMIVSSSLMYSIECDAQPEAFENVFSGLWWAISTFTTVGYGDIYPITVPGKILCGVASLLGIGLVAVPTGIISSGFVELNAEEQKLKREKEMGAKRQTDLRLELEKLKAQVDLIAKMLDGDDVKGK